MLLNFAQQNVVLLKVYKKIDTDCYCHVFLCLDGGNMAGGGVVLFSLFCFKDSLELSPLPISI